MEKHQKRRDDYVKPVQLSEKLKKIEDKLQEIIWAHAQIKQLERLPSTIVVDEIRTSLMEIVTGFACINTIDPIYRGEDGPLDISKASLQVSMPAKPELSSSEILELSIQILKNLSGWKASLIVHLLSDVLKDSNRMSSDVT